MEYSLLWHTLYIIKVHCFFTISIGIGTTIVIMLLSILDGLQLRISMKILFGVTCSMYYTLFALFYAFYQVDEHQYNDIALDISENISISTRQILTSSTQILAVFFWRQTISSIFKKNRCAMITYAPYIRWERNTNINIESEYSNKPKPKNLSMLSKDIEMDIKHLDGYKNSKSNDKDTPNNNNNNGHTLSASLVINDSLDKTQKNLVKKPNLKKVKSAFF